MSLTFNSLATVRVKVDGWMENCDAAFASWTFVLSNYC